MAFERDWAYLQAALAELRDYILSRDLYWPLRLPHKPGSAQTPQLTIGNLLLTLASISARPMSSSQTVEVSALKERIETLRSEWRSNWGLKAAREYSSRLNLWQQYVRELRGDPRGQAAYYANEVRQRAILLLLGSEILDGIPAHEEEQVAMLDNVLHSLTQPGAFVWEAELQDAFHQADYWFLYVQVKK